MFLRNPWRLAATPYIFVIRFLLSLRHSECRHCLIVCRSPSNRVHRTTVWLIPASSVAGDPLRPRCLCTLHRRPSARPAHDGLTDDKCRAAFEVAAEVLFWPVPRVAALCDSFFAAAVCRAEKCFLRPMPCRTSKHEPFPLKPPRTLVWPCLISRFHSSAPCRTLASRLSDALQFSFPFHLRHGRVPAFAVVCARTSVNHAHPSITSAAGPEHL